MKWWPSELLPGDMIRVKIGSIYHYGIYCSESEVIQFGEPPVSLFGRSDDDIAVCAASIEEFSCGNIVEKAVLDKKEARRRFSAKKTVRTARSRLGEKGYNLLHNNCEHFVYECVFGVKQSTQEQEALKKWHDRAVMDVYIAPMPAEVSVEQVDCKARNRQIGKTKQAQLKAARYYDWYVLQNAAYRSFGVNVKDIDFHKSLAGKWTCDSFFFSLAHTSDMVVVGVSNKKIGVDTEKLSEFGKGKKQLAENGSADFSDDFIVKWIKNESIYKCSGKRISSSKSDTHEYKTSVVSLADRPDYLFSVCGEIIDSVHYYLFENGTAKLIDTKLIKSEP